MKRLDLIIEVLGEYVDDNNDSVDKDRAALVAARELREMKCRDAYICGRCDGVYADEKVSECDCEVGVEPIFKRGFIFYALGDEK